MTPVEYAIPSRERSQTLVEKTLPLLRRLGVPPERINVFVAPVELAEYEQAIARAFPGGKTICRLTVGSLGVASQRNGILDYYPPATPVVSFDDDLRDLVVRRNEKTLEPITVDEWEEVVHTGFDLVGRGVSRMWGLYPVPNPYFMKPKVRTDLCYVAAGCYGFLSDPEPDSPLRVSLEDKEDFERSLQVYVADGALVRFEYVSWKTTGYEGAGGMQADGLRTPERILESARELVRRYPGLAKLNLTKKSGKAELRLRDSRPRQSSLA